MILPILAYGHPKLRQNNNDITKNYPNLKNLISDMWETLYADDGAGLAAPQIGKSIRLFIVDSVQIYKNSNSRGRERFIGDEGIKEVFINPEITETNGNMWIQAEGCLSFPTLSLDIGRKISCTIKYLNENFEEKERIFIGTTARVILHEYDHIEGILFTDYINKEAIKDELEKISRGDVNVNYKMVFNNSPK